MTSLKRVAEVQLAIKKLGERRLAHMLPLPPPEAGWTDQKTPDGGALVEKELDAESPKPGSGVETAQSNPSAPAVQANEPISPAPPPDPATLAMPAPPGAPTSAAVVAYGKGDYATLVALAKASNDPDERLGLEWAALKIDPTPFFLRTFRFPRCPPDLAGRWMDPLSRGGGTRRPSAAAERPRSPSLPHSRRSRARANWLTPERLLP